jgi:hypothetical protein
MDQNKLGLLAVIGGLVKYAGICILTGFSLATGGLTGWMQQRINRKEEDSHEEILEETS